MKSKSKTSTESITKNFYTEYLENPGKINPYSITSLRRGRQMFSGRKPIIINEINNISNHSTCETKHILSRQINFKPKKRFKKPKKESSSSQNEKNISDSDSISSSEMRKKRFLEEENSFTYPTRKEVGLYSSEEDSSEMESPLKENLENEIERNLIEIYNKNISNCNYNNNSKFCNQCDKMNNYRIKKNKGLSNSKNELKLTFKQLNEQYNYFALQVLSKKIKELINKYREKILEIPEISVIYTKYKNKKEELNNNTSTQSQNKGNLKESSNQFTIASFYKTTAIFKQQFSSPCLLKKPFNSSSTNIPSGTLLITPQSKLSSLILQNEITEHGITNILLKELINIKHTLKRSSYEIQQIFQYPLSLLKKKFSIEKIHLEAFNNILLSDELISTLILQIKLIFNQINAKEILDLISIIEDDSNYKYREMTNFDREINQNIGIEFDLFDGNSIEDLTEGNSKINMNNNVNNIKKNTTTPTSSSSIEYKNGNNNDFTEKKRIDSDIDIDELIKYIDSDGDSAGNSLKSKKKKKKKNKKKNNNNNNMNNNVIEKNDESKDNVDIEVESFKEEINKCSINSFQCQKLKPCISPEWLNSIKCK